MVETCAAAADEVTRANVMKQAASFKNSVPWPAAGHHCEPSTTDTSQSRRCSCSASRAEGEAVRRLMTCSLGKQLTVYCQLSGYTTSRVGSRLVPYAVRKRTAIRHRLETLVSTFWILPRPCYGNDGGDGDREATACTRCGGAMVVLHED